MALSYSTPKTAMYYINYTVFANLSTVAFVAEIGYNLIVALTFAITIMSETRGKTFHIQQIWPNFTF